MKIKAILFTVLLGFSVNVLAIEPVLKDISPLKTELSADKKQAIRQDLDKFLALIKVQFDIQEKKQEG